MKVPTFRQSLIGAVGTALTAFLTVSISSMVDSYSSIDDRLSILELDSSKWNTLAEHETRIRELEISTRVHEEYLSRLMDHSSNISHKQLQDNLLDIIGSESSSKEVQQQVRMPVKAIDPDLFRNQKQKASKYNRKK